MKPPPLPVRRMSRWDFYGVLFVNFPVAMPWDEAREILERMIRRTGETEITPSTIEMAFMFERTHQLRNLPPEKIAEKVAAAWKDRAERIAPKLKPKKINIEDWSF